MWLEPGLSTLLHSSELSWTKKNPSAKKMIKIGFLGDICSGKSFASKQFGYPVFDSDKEVLKIYKKDFYIHLSKNIHIVRYPIL